MRSHGSACVGPVARPRAGVLVVPAAEGVGEVLRQRRAHHRRCRARRRAGRKRRAVGEAEAEALREGRGPSRREERPPAGGEGGVCAAVPLFGGVAEVVALAALDVLPVGERYVEVVVAAPIAPAARGAVVVVGVGQPRPPPVLRLCGGAEPADAFSDPSDQKRFHHLTRCQDDA